MNAPAMIVSKNRLEGSLSDTPLRQLLESCHKHLVTGAIKITDEKTKKSGVLVLRAGAVDQARWGDWVGDTAVAQMVELKDGMYELSQQLPDLSGDLGRAAALEGAVDQVSVVQIMRHCEHNALSAVITVINDFDRGEIHYRAGDLEQVTLNGERDDDAIVTMLGWAKARYRVSAPPLASEIGGWPKVGREQTQPFKIEKRDDALLPPQVQAARQKTEAKAAEKAAKLPKAPVADESFAAAEAPAPTPAAPVAPEGKKGEPARAAGKETVKSKEAARATVKVATPAPELEAPRRRSMAGTLVQAFLLTLAATLVLTFVALLASR